MKKLFSAILVTMLGLGLGGLVATAQENEPVFFEADFNETTDHSLRPGEDTVLFFTDLGDRSLNISQGGFGRTDQPGDEALELLFELDNPSFFGFLINLAPNGASVDISEYGVLEFDMRLGSEEGFSDWVVRLEDRDGDAEFNNLSLPIEGLTTEWQTFTFPLSDFLAQTGAPVVDLTQVFQIVFSTDNNPGGMILFDLLVDNVTIKGTGDNQPPETPSAEPLASFTADFEDGTLVNSNGGELFIRAAQGNPFSNEAEEINVEVVQEGLEEEAQSAHISGGFEVLRTDFSYIEVRFSLNADRTTPHDISAFDTLRIVAREGDGDNANWGIRMRDINSVESDFLNSTVFIEDQLADSYSVIDIPLAEFEADANGEPVDLSQILQIFIVVDGDTETSSLRSDLYIDELTLVDETNIGGWSIY